MSKLYVNLGRMGDVISILPMLKKDADAGERPRLMVAKEYASILDGVSYIEPVIFDGPHTAIAAAVAQAEKLADKVICLQVNGRDVDTETRIASIAVASTPTEFIVHKDAMAKRTEAPTFEEQSWHVAGRLKDWLAPLVFDRRDEAREQALLRSCGMIKRGWKKPILLLALEGNTSPFPYADLLRELVTLKFSETYQIVELPKAERIYDLLALYEKATLLIAIDSAPLHLAWACPALPVFALTQDKPSLWHGTPWRPNHVWYCRYHNWPERAAEMLSMIPRPNQIEFIPSKIVVWSAYESPENTGVKDALAITVGMCSRDSSTVLGDSKRVPFLRDVLRMATQRCPADDTKIVLRRPGVRIETPSGPSFAYRIQDGQYRPVVDLFCATKAWWKKIMPEIPDLLLSGDYMWSEALLSIFKSHGAVDATGCCSFIPDSKPKRVWGGFSKAHMHNAELCRQIVVKTKTFSRYPKVSEQLPTHWVRSPLLPPFQYNPSITRQGDQLWLTYRYHPDPKSPVTRIGLARLNDDFSVVSAKQMEIAGPAQDDGRLFSLHGETWMSWVEALTYTRPVRAVMKYASLAGRLDHEGKVKEPWKIHQVYQPTIGSNDGTSAQKNWVFFEWHDTLFCIYQSHAEYDVHQIQGNASVRNYKSAGVKWPYGEIRGGNIVPWNGKLLRFFHSRLENEIGPLKHRYFIGALTMEAVPPFKVLAVSQKPILYGSEVDDLKPAQRLEVPFHNPNVAFPCGVIQHNDGWLLSVGVNHGQVCLVTVKEKDLQL